MPNFFWLDKNPVDAVKTTKTLEVMTIMPFNAVSKTIYTDAYIAGAAKEVEVRQKWTQ